MALKRHTASNLSPSGSMAQQVCLITGGASGMGLAVARSLAQKNWKVVIADTNIECGTREATAIKGLFVRTDVKDYNSLQKAFDQAYLKYGEINFVFANAGVGERQDLYKKINDQDLSEPPRELDLIIDLDLKSVINTAYLALHYFRKNPTGASACIVLNASIAGLYPVRFCPIYTAAKHGVVGFARAISQIFHEADGIRVNTLCPGNVRTNLFTADEWAVFDMQWIELSQIVKIVEMMLFDQSMHGKVIEAAPQNYYIIDPLVYKDENVAKTLEGPDVRHLGR